MTHGGARLVPVLLVCACAAGCVQDTVYPGFYGEPQVAQQQVAGAPAAPTGSVGTSPGVTGAPAAGSAAPSLPGSSVEVAGLGGDAVAGNGGAVASGAGAGAPVPEDVERDACDLSGRWLATMHFVTDALGQYQTAHSFLYYEIERQGDAFVVEKGLHCGDEALAEGLFAVTVNFRSTWESVVPKVSYAGRGVSSAQTSAGCEVRFDKWYVVRGATNPHYTDPSIPMPTLDQPASGTTPGWEDWDGDGQPGLTGILSGTVSGRIFVAPRQWNQLSGTVPDTRQHLVVPVSWDQEPNMLSYDGSPLLASESVRAADPSLHFAELARLGPTQATGDDLAICRAIVELAPTLTPRASAL